MLKPQIHNLKRTLNDLKVIVLSLSLVSTLSISQACGKRKPPLPPVERVVQRVEISGFQRGKDVRLAWKMPPRNAGGNSVTNIAGADIYRLAESARSTQTLTEEDFASQATLIASVPFRESDFAQKQFSYTDKLNFAGKNIRLRYAIRFVNSTGSKASFSNFLLIEPLGKVAEPPILLPLRISQDEIILTWKSPEANIDGSKPANVIGFNIYRAKEDEKTAKLLNNTPITGNTYEDSFFEFGVKYKYFLRSISVGVEAVPVESQESEIVEILAKDTFPPSPPTNITLAAAMNSISIFFVSNPEKDIAGYKIYRSINQVTWQLLSDKLLTTNTFQDTQVEHGKTYYYYLTAVDKSGNVSLSSAVVSEKVP